MFRRRREPGPPARRVLFVAFHFPPDGEIGSVRPYQFARHLGDFGFEPWILTVRPEFAERLDPAFRVEGIPEEHVIRTVKARTLRDVLLEWGQKVRPSELTPHSSAADADPSGSASPRHPLQKAIVANSLALLAFPDKHIGWRRPAVVAGQDLMSRVRFDAIVSSSPPRVTHLIARALARRHRVPWVMDFRDPWYIQPGLLAATAMLRFLHSGLFHRHASRGDAIVANTERLRASIAATLGRPARTLCIPNGFDRSSGASEVAEPEGFAIGYFGQFMGGRDVLPFLRGLRLWIDRGGTRPRDVRVRFVGSGFEEVQRRTAELELAAHVRFEAPVSRDQVPDLLAQQYVLLLVATDQPLQLPGKAYEYLTAGRRILAVTEPDGATADFLAGLPGCLVVSTPEGAAEALERFWCERQAGAAASIDHSRRLEAGTYLQRTRELAGLLEDLIRTREGLRG
jgi:glycosyltransferase involved in cell wall biosynthesis